MYKDREGSGHLLYEALIFSSVIFVVVFFSILSSGFLHSAFYALDEGFSNLIGTIASASVAQFFLFFTYLGNAEIIFAVECCALLIFLVFHRRRDIVLFMGALFTGQIVSFLFKIIAERPRPTDGLLPILGSDSFPSGHALTAMVFYGLIAYLFTRSVKSRVWKTIIAASAATLIFLIGFSRIYLGVHWLSDVIAGWALGGVILSLFILLFERTKHVHEKSRVTHPGHEYVAFSQILLGALLASLTFFIVYFYVSNPLPLLP